MSMEDMHFSQLTTFGDHLYRHKDEIAKIIMENTRTGIQKTIVDDNGMIADFPGFAYPDLVSLYNNGVPSGRIQFRSDISKLGEQYALIWQIQPDGRYWEDDDGFGMTTDDEIDLYAHLDETGHFAESFHIYSIGSNKLYGTDAEEQLIETLRMKVDPLSSLREHTSEMLDVMKEQIKTPANGKAEYFIPGTIYQAAFELRTELGKWYVRASMKKRYSDTCFVGYLQFAPQEEQREYLNSAQAFEDAEKTLMILFSQIKRKG